MDINLSHFFINLSVLRKVYNEIISVGGGEKGDTDYPVLGS
jgi:hypothetical protein